MKKILSPVRGPVLVIAAVIDLIAKGHLSRKVPGAANPKKQMGNKIRKRIMILTGLREAGQMMQAAVSSRKATARANPDQGLREGMTIVVNLRESTMIPKGPRGITILAGHIKGIPSIQSINEEIMLTEQGNPIRAGRGIHQTNRGTPMQSVHQTAQRGNTLRQIIGR